MKTEAATDMTNGTRRIGDVWFSAAQAAVAIGVTFATCAMLHASSSTSQNPSKQAPAECVPLPPEVIRSPVFRDWLRTNAIDRRLCRRGSVDIKKYRSAASGFQLQSECQEAIKAAGGRAQMIVSPSGRRAVCREPENDVFLVGLAKGEGRWLKDCGTPCNYDTGFWLGDDRFVLLERDDIEGGAKRFTPVVVTFDLMREAGEHWTTGTD